MSTIPTASGDISVDALPQWHHGYVQGGLIPAIQELGVSDAEVERMTLLNPSAFIGARSAGQT